MISPEIKTVSGQELSFYWWGQPLFLFKLDNVNFETGEYVGDKVIAANMEVYVRGSEGESKGEWQRVFDFSSQYEDYTYEELIYATPENMKLETVGLGDMSGKSIQIAFRYVGQDGDTMIVDAIGVAYPMLNAMYSMPYTQKISDSATMPSGRIPRSHQQYIRFSLPSPG